MCAARLRCCSHSYDPFDSQLIAGRAEDVLDVLRYVGELVARVAVAPAANVHSVRPAPAVGMNERPEECLGLRFSQFQLPQSQSDISLMLGSWPMLRKQTRPLPRVRTNFNRVLMGVSKKADLAFRHHGAHGRLALANDAVVATVKRDAKPEDAAVDMRNRPVAQIETQQIDVLLSGQGLPDMRWRTALRAGTPRPPYPRWHLTAEPCATGCPRYARAPRNLGNGQAFGSQPQDELKVLGAAHR
jgi:hypothetical protein